MAGRMRIGMASAAMAWAAVIAVVATQPCAAQDEVAVVHTGGLDGLLISPKDEGLKRALRLLDERVLELPMEVGDPSMPAPAFRLALDLLMRPMSARLGLLPGIEEMDLERLDGPPFRGQVDFYTAAPEEAGSLAEELGQLLQMVAPQAPAADPEHPGMQLIDADGAAVRYGAGTVGGRNALSIALNGYDTEVVRLNLEDLPAGVQPAFAMQVNTAPLLPLIEKALESAPAEQRPMIEMQMQMYGLNAEQPLRIIAAAGYGADRSHSFLRVVNGRAFLDAQRGLADASLTQADLALVPADATYAEVRKFNPASFTHMMETMRQQMPPHMQGQDPFMMMQQMTGIDIQRDIIDHLGQTYWTYTADSTGGGLTGYVSIVELSDPAGMQATLDNLTQMANQMAHGPARGYVRFISREVGGHPMTVLTFPGLPIPLEVSCAIVGTRMYSALSPQSVLSAVAQATNPSGTLLQNPRFVEMGGGVPEGAIQVAFLDTPRLARSGYGLVSMGMAALSNAVRSPRDPSRDPGLVMPSVTELLDGAKAAVWITRIDGDDLLVRSQGDRSVIVNMCGLGGAMGGASGAAAAGALVGGVMLSAIGQARMQAKATHSMAQLRNIAMAAHVYAAEHDGRMPESLEQLIETGYLIPEALDSAIGDMDDGVDFAIRPTGLFSEVTFPDRQILAWDRVMAQQGGRVNVAFCDGHVESLDPAELRRLLSHPSNEGVQLAGH